MKTSETLWKLFQSTGNIGVYLVYKEYQGFEVENNGLGFAGPESWQEGMEGCHERI